MTRMTAALAVLLGVFVLPGAVAAQIRMTRLDENSKEVTIENFSATTTVDVSGYFMCRAPGTYQQLSSLAIVGGGDLNLSPGEEVTIVYSFIVPSGTGIGLYVNGANFGSAANIADYMQYKGVTGFRESVAVAAGIWTAATFATGDPGPYFYLGGGSDNGAAFWTNAPQPVTVPLSGAWPGSALLAGSMLTVGVLGRQRIWARLRIRG